jgi:hypothetical protein
LSICWATLVLSTPQNISLRSILILSSISILVFQVVSFPQFSVSKPSVLLPHTSHSSWFNDPDNILWESAVRTDQLTFQIKVTMITITNDEHNWLSCCVIRGWYSGMLTAHVQFCVLTCKFSTLSLHSAEWSPCIDWVWYSPCLSDWFRALVFPIDTGFAACKS